MGFSKARGQGQFNPFVAGPREAGFWAPRLLVGAAAEPLALRAEVWPRLGLVWVAGTDAYSDSGSLEFSEHWELAKEVRGLSLFPLHSLRLVPESQLSCSALFWRSCPKWGWELLQVLGSLGEAEDEAALPRCCFPAAQAERFLSLPCPPPQPKKQVGPPTFPQRLPGPVDLWPSWDVT